MSASAHKRTPSLRNRRVSVEASQNDLSVSVTMAPPRTSSLRPALREEESFDEWDDVESGNGHGHLLQQQSKEHLLRSPAMNNLPSGAATPNLESTRQGNPVVTFPPPEPTWANLPNKVQLAILAASRFVDFFQMAALNTFMVHQLKSFDESLPDDVIQRQSGMLLGSFTAAQIVTSILWGRAADQPTVGRKLVLQIGLIGTGFGCIGMGFSKSYGQAVAWRFFSGAINGTVGSARTMVAEITPKPWHPRAFLLLPAAFNVANVLGPILAGLLSDPIVNLPHLFGPGSTFGGATGVPWMRAYPYAAANWISTVVLWGEAVLVHFFLEETLKGKRPLELSSFDPITLVRNVYTNFVNVKNKGYQALREQRQGLLGGGDRGSFEMDRMNSSGEKIDEKPVQRLPFRRIWTPNVLWVLLTVGIFDFHMGAFSNLWIVFLSFHRQFTAGVDTVAPPANIPAQAPADGKDAVQMLTRDVVLQPRGLFKFAAGLGFPPATIGFAMAIIGFIGIVLQFLLYPWANAKFGLMRAFRGALFLFPAAYCLAPYIALLPSATAPPEPASGWFVWMGISIIIFLQVAARTFALPATIILINNSSPHPSVLATIHGIGQATSATFRTLGPIASAYWFGMWTKRGIIGMAWWIVGIISGLGCIASFWVRNGSGHEIFLPGEEPEMKDSETGGGSGDGR